ncbi:MAG: hypothetical protein U5P41_05390 [Gammaproteobacteria bacterium]|nr:hypothetical protein [Gammaproteobacteria bacterium]
MAGTEYRDATLILLAYRHALRVSELVNFAQEQVDLKQGLLYVTRRQRHAIRIRCAARNCAPCND